MTNKKKKVGYPEKGTLYEYVLNINTENFGYQWVKWADLIETPEKPKKFELHNIRVKTSDTLKYNYVIAAYLSQ